MFVSNFAATFVSNFAAVLPPNFTTMEDEICDLEDEELKQKLSEKNEAVLTNVSSSYEDEDVSRTEENIRVATVLEKVWARKYVEAYNEAKQCKEVVGAYEAAKQANREDEAAKRKYEAATRKRKEAKRNLSNIQGYLHLQQQET